MILIKHSHDGDSCYFAYVHLNCRHSDCKAAAVEYRQRLQQRRRQGDWRDLRFKDQKDPPILRVEPISVADGPVVGADPEVPPEPVTTKPMSPEEAGTALLELARSKADSHGLVTTNVLARDWVARELGIRSDDAQAALHAVRAQLVYDAAAGKVRVLQAPAPEPPVAPVVPNSGQRMRVRWNPSTNKYEAGS